MKLVKVEYEVLEPVLDFHTAKDNPVLVHPEDNWRALHRSARITGATFLCAHDECGNGDIDAILADCDVVIDRVYHTQACQQAMMETFRTYCEIDTYGRLHIISSTQIVFHPAESWRTHCISRKSKVRVTKPRIGGGFGAKADRGQRGVSGVCHLDDEKAVQDHLQPRGEPDCIFTAPRDGNARPSGRKQGPVSCAASTCTSLFNTGAYGEHGPTTVGLSGHKSIPLYGKAEAFRFTSDVVYTNHMSAGAYRGYGATQGLFAVESAVNELANILGMDPFKIREMNITHEVRSCPRTTVR